MINETGAVKWFDPRKGYGFIASPIGDVRIHATDLRSAGFADVSAGAVVRYLRRDGTSRVSAVVDVCAAPSTAGAGAPVTGAVKWYNVKTGLGFIVRDGAPDLMFTASTMRTSGLAWLVKGDAVEVTIERRATGDKATHVKRVSR